MAVKQSFVAGMAGGAPRPGAAKLCSVPSEIIFSAASYVSWSKAPPTSCVAPVLFGAVSKKGKAYQNRAPSLLEPRVFF